MCRRSATTESPRRREPVLLRMKDPAEEQEREGSGPTARSVADVPAATAAPTAPAEACPRALRRKKQHRDIRADRQKREGKQHEQPWPQPEIRREDERPEGLSPRSSSEIAEARREELQVTAEPPRARPRHRGGRGGGLVERERAAQRADGDALREKGERRLRVLRRRPRRGRGSQAKGPRRKAHALAAQTHGQALRVAREVVEPRLGKGERLDARRAGSGDACGPHGQLEDLGAVRHVQVAEEPLWQAHVGVEDEDEVVGVELARPCARRRSASACPFAGPGDLLRKVRTPSRASRDSASGSGPSRRTRTRRTSCPPLSCLLSLFFQVLGEIPDSRPLGARRESRRGSSGARGRRARPRAPARRREAPPPQEGVARGPRRPHGEEAATCREDVHAARIVTDGRAAC